MGVSGSLITSSAILSQSSTYTNTGGIFQSASYAIDPNINKCTHTHHSTIDRHQWWQLRFGFTATVTKVVIWNARSPYHSRLYGSTLELLDTDFNVKASATITIGQTADPKSQTFTFNSVPDIAIVRVTHGNNG